MQAKRVRALILFALASAAVAGDTENWSVEYQKVSGWGSGDRILISSDGQSAICDDSRCVEPVFCPEVVLTVEEVDTISALVDRMVGALPADSMLWQHDHCDDESENMVTVISEHQRRTFRYTTDESCRSVNQVPEWMSNFAAVLQGFEARMANCPATLD